MTIAEYNERLRVRGLTLTLLAVLECMGRHEGCSITDLARYLGKGRTTIDGRLHRLRRLGYCRYLAWDEDGGRGCWLTVEGRETLVLMRRLMTMVKGDKSPYVRGTMYDVRFGSSAAEPRDEKGGKNGW